MSVQSGEPRSRRDRPAKPALTRASIVAAARRDHARPRGCPRSPCGAWPRTWTPARPRCTCTSATRPSCTRRSWTSCWARSRRLRPPVTGAHRLEQVLTDYTLMLFEHPSLARSALVTRPQRRALPGPGRDAAGPAGRGRRAIRAGRLGRGHPAPVRHRDRGRARHPAGVAGRRRRVGRAARDRAHHVGGHPPAGGRAGRPAGLRRAGRAAVLGLPGLDQRHRGHPHPAEDERR